MRALLDASTFDFSRLHGHRQITDAYLLALAVRNDGRLVTLDSAVSLTAARKSSICSSFSGARANQEP